MLPFAIKVLHSSHSMRPAKALGYNPFEIEGFAGMFFCTRIRIVCKPFLIFFSELTPRNRFSVTTEPANKIT